LVVPARDGLRFGTGFGDEAAGFFKRRAVDDGDDRA